MTNALGPILDTVLDGRWKGFPQDRPPTRLGDVGALGLRLPAGDLDFPCAVLRASALDHNQRFMQEFLRQTGASLCPHGKTTMAPQLFHRQLADGAWGITVATAQQARVAIDYGVKRILLANELAHPPQIRALQSALDADPALDLLCLVDSLEGTRLLEAHAAGRRPIPVLVELGYPGGRAGSRTVDGALAVARAAASSPRLVLRGVECFEGLLQSADGAPDVPRVTALLDDLVALARRADAEGLFTADEILVTAGGSAYFDLVARAAQTPPLSRPIRLVLRSGCTLTHDDGHYARLVARLQERLTPPWTGPSALLPAIEIWSRVLSRPEPGLAILSMGKRDVAHDIDLPVPRRCHRPGPGGPSAAPAAWRIARLNDQHAYLDVPPADPIRPGDLVGCGISHPCTTLDKWQLLFVVDDEDRVTEAIRTFF